MGTIRETDGGVVYEEMKQHSLKKAVFLDRDGTIIALTRNFRTELRDIKELKLLPGVAKAIRILNERGFLVFIHTNQAVVARGRLTEEKLVLIHKELQRRLKEKGAWIDAFYYCPHHPKAAIKKYKIICLCRKPKTGMIRKAIKDFNVDRKRSFIIGDHTRDILTGRRAGMKTILVKTGHGGEDGTHAVEPDMIVKNLFEAALLIKKTH